MKIIASCDPYMLHFLAPCQYNDNTIQYDVIACSVVQALYSCGPLGWCPIALMADHTYAGCGCIKFQHSLLTLLLMQDLASLPLFTSYFSPV